MQITGTKPGRRRCLYLSALILPKNIESEHKLKILFESGSLYEVRILEGPRNATVSGYFDNLEALEKAVAKYDGKGNIYHTLNPVKPALFARAANRLKPWAKATTGDLDILRRYWLLVDLDPKRPTGIMASAEEKEAAMQKGREVYAWLQAQRWPKPVLIDSGNGPHLRYPIDLPNDEASRGLLKNCLEALALRFDDEFVNIDCSVFNAGRIARLPDYMNVKGDNIESRPHRRSKFLNVPNELEQVPLDLLKKLADMIPKPQVEPNRLHFKGEFDLPKWITDHELPVVSTSDWNGGKRKYCKNHISLGNNDLRVQDEFRRNQKLLQYFTKLKTHIQEVAGSKPAKHLWLTMYLKDLRGVNYICLYKTTCQEHRSPSTRILLSLKR